MRRGAAYAAALLTLAALGGGVAYRMLGAPPAPHPSLPVDRRGETPPPAATPGKPQTLKLYCQFYVFTEQRPRVAFYFEVTPKGDDAGIRQIYVAEDNGARTDYDGVQNVAPEWRLDRKVEPPRIVSRIPVTDTSQAAFHDEDIAIELYGYVPTADSPAFFEASLKNVHYQNLPGKCRQSGGPA